MTKRKVFGFTLIEMLLVLAIIAALVVMGLRYAEQTAETARINRVTYQMQYILNAGLAYYVANGSWPGTSGTTYDTSYGAAASGGSGGAQNPGALQPNYLAAVALYNPFGGAVSKSYYYYGYNLGFPLTSGGASSAPTTPTTPTAPTTPTTPGVCSNTNWVVPCNTFEVIAYIGTTPRDQARGQIIAGSLPFGYYDPTSGAVVSYVNIPGYNLNNASAINFAGLYHHGACVPVPSCPGTTVPEVFVVPVSVAGVNDYTTTGGVNTTQTNLYPISSFTAYATAPSAAGESPVACTNVAGTEDTSAATCGTSTEYFPSSSGQAWRACLQVVTEKGNVATTNLSEWGNYVTLAAFTRCAIPGEPIGSNFTVYTH